MSRRIETRVTYRGQPAEYGTVREATKMLLASMANDFPDKWKEVEREIPAVFQWEASHYSSRLQVDLVDKVSSFLGLKYGSDVTMIPVSAEHRKAWHAAGHPVRVLRKRRSDHGKTRAPRMATDAELMEEAQQDINRAQQRLHCLKERARLKEARGFSTDEALDAWLTGMLKK